VLELASGSGRIAVALAAAGHDVTGVDRDSHMLERARAAWARRRDQPDAVAGGALHLVEADILDLGIDRRFGLVILALNSLLLLGEDAAKSGALRAMARHLSGDGRAVLDVWLPTSEDLALYDGKPMLDWVRDDPETGERVSKSWSATYDEGADRATVTTTFETSAGGRTLRRDDVWFIGAPRLIELARGAGLEPETVAGDYDLSPSTPRSERVVLICRRGTAPAGLR
jgi:SAM-dependent methyltransferase